MSFTQVEINNALGADRNWVLGVNFQRMSFCGVGLCDPVLNTLSRGLSPMAYDSGLFAVVMAGGNFNTSTGAIAAGVNTDGNALTAQAGAALTLFTSGVGGPIGISSTTGGAFAATWFTKTISDTDLNLDGSPAPRGQMLMVSGFMVEVHEPFQRGGTGAAAADAQKYSAWLEMQDAGPGYSQRIIKHLMNNLGMSLTFGEAGQTFRVGTPTFHPHYAGPAGSQSTRNGQTGTPGLYFPLMSAFCIGTKEDLRQLTLTLTNGQAFEVQSDATTQTIAGSATAGIINTANEGTIYSKLRVSVVGKPICAPVGGVCGVSASDLDPALRAQLGIPG